MQVRSTYLPVHQLKFKKVSPSHRHQSETSNDSTGKSEGGSSQSKNCGHKGSIAQKAFQNPALDYRLNLLSYGVVPGDITPWIEEEMGRHGKA